MPAVLRLFFAVPIDDAARVAVLGIRDVVRRETGRTQVKWVEDGNLHLSLKFLGDTPSDLVPHMTDVACEVAGRHSAFHFALHGVGAFPKAQTPRVIWIGLSNGREPMAALAGDLDTALEYAAVARRETRPFEGHLTLGRVKLPQRNDALAAAIGSAGDLEAGRVRCDHFLLMRSELSRQGPTYTVLQRFDLLEGTQNGKGA
jgi:2'-5' RNA ligase